MMSIFIDGWETNLKFSAAHFIPEHSKCRRLHGHDYAIDVKIYGELRNGMVADFVQIKKELRTMLEEIDHKLILPVDGEGIKFEKIGNNYSIRYETFEMSIPGEFVYLCDVRHSSSEELARFLTGVLRKKVDLGDNLRKIELSVYEGPGQKATWEEEIG
ncbi:MAG: 6-carboxytetrahydropterin synthase [Candidatus Thermoplasmatota archaeon]|nr:6-carboxytetrahydropterin synthase [Candidatus Thermoplasmatota archaeon]